jgi:ADP-ribose pyrophosphatase YjhB (NUDIX family)
VLLAKRSRQVSTFAGCWAGISGYIEGDEPLHRALVEVEEECGIERSGLTLIRAGQPFVVADAATGRKFLVHPFMFRVSNPQAIRHDLEATRFEWVEVNELLERRRQPTVPQLYEAFAAVWPPGGATEATATPPNLPAFANRLLRLLLDRRTYPDATASVEYRETHISWIFLTDRYVYKVKKPVRFEFLDFGTQDARRRACEEEIRLNHRMAPLVYLGVVPITDEGNGRLALAGTGSVVESAVKMRRLPAERMLDELIRRGQLTADDVSSLAAALAQFYDDAPPLTLPTLDYRRRVEHHVRENLAELSTPAHGLPADLVRRVHQGQHSCSPVAPRFSIAAFAMAA